MDYDSVIRKQRMTRRFDQSPVPRELLEKLLTDAQKAPSAGFTQGVAFLVLQGAETGLFWQYAAKQVPLDGTQPPVIILALANKQAYLNRYSLPDKAGTGMHSEEGWPTPYWLIDSAFASMVVMLSATASGLGCWIFGIFGDEDKLLRELNVPKEFSTIGAIALGYPAPRVTRPSLKSRRKKFEDFAQFGKWQAPKPE